MINIISLLQEHGIEHILTGPNVARDHVNIKCCFCGDADPSMHMGIRLSDLAWGCWRDPTHRGRRPHRLLNKLLGMSFNEVDILMQGTLLDTYAVDLEEIANPKPVKPDDPYKIATFPDHFNELKPTRFGKNFLDYLIYRKFERTDIESLVQEYKLHYSLIGKWAWRLIIPIYLDKNLVAWTGRHIRGSEKRYESSSKYEGMDIKSTLLNFDSLKETEGPVLVINEGPFDCMKIDFYGRRFGIRATCIFGIDISDNQVYLLKQLQNQYRMFILMLDSTEAINSLHTLNVHRGNLRLQPFNLPNGVKDAGDLYKAEVEDLAYLLLNYDG